MTGTQARLIAFYLPQFHPILENDEWWGKGFTEWTNVAKAKPLFPGHYQPHIPADLGFYDLRVPETRLAQAEMAQKYGIEGFCYWHYWFAGKRLLDRPFAEVLKSGEPDFPFCLAWANQTWTGIWHGAPGRVLIEQTYPGESDYVSHFHSILEAFRDERYLTVDGRKAFIVYVPRRIPDPRLFTDLWRELARKNGLGGVYFMAVCEPGWDPRMHGFDAAIVNSSIRGREDQGKVSLRVKGLLNKDLRERLGVTAIHRCANSARQAMSAAMRGRRRIPSIFDYAGFVSRAFPERHYRDWEYPMVVPNWDNTPRSGLNGIVLHRSSPELFKSHLRNALGLVEDRTYDRRIVFIKSWNEWAEGNHLEPDFKYGHGYLEALRNELSGQG